MKKYLIDTHAHIDMLGDNFEQADDIIVKNAIDEMSCYNVKSAIIPSVEVKTLDRIVDIANKYKNIYCMIGIFPTEAHTYTDELEIKMENIAKNNSKVVAVGEIGLDYHWDTSFIELQKEIFIRQIKLANKLNLPIVVHDRDAHKDCFDLLKEYNKSSKVLFHCFSGSVEYMRECVKEGWYIAIGGVVTFKNALKIKEVAIDVPIDKLVLETDSPYLTPVPFRGKPNRPAFVKYVAEAIAELRDMTYDEIAETTSANAERFFNL